MNSHMKYLIIFFLFFSYPLFSQTVNKTDLKNRPATKDTLVIDSGTQDSLKIFKPTIYDYQSQTQFSEKVILDTVLAPNKTYIFSQWNNKDNFGKHQFANIGSGFNPLVYEFNPEQNLSVLPTNKSFGILGINDIRYYDVKTPTTSFIYHNAMRNGASLHSTYTQNVGKNFNFAVEYLGLRSQGLYQNSLASNNNTLFSAHYKTENSRYEAYAHYLHQNVNNQEYGGIAEDDLFQEGTTGINNRFNLDVNLQGSDSKFWYRRYYLVHQFTPFNSQKFPFKIRHQIFHQGNKYRYNQDAVESFYYSSANDLVTGYPLNSGKYSDNFSNTVSLVFDKEKFKIDGGVRYQMLKTGVYNAITVNGETIPEEIKENRIGAVGNLEIKLWDKVKLNSFLEISRGGQFGNFIRSANKFRFEPIKDYFVNGKINFQSAKPTFSYLLNASVYRNFNFYVPQLDNQTILEIGGDINLKWFKTNLFANYFRIDNFTYFDQTAMPKQSGSSVNISQIGGDATFSYGKFHLNSRILFQSTLTNKLLFPAPNFVGRANIYYQGKIFKNAAEIQTGLKANFFSKFASRDYFPVLNEYILPSSSSYSIGGKPFVDAYFNMKVKRMFFFIEGQHLNATIWKNKSYTFPRYPFYDFRLNIGIVWHLIH